MSLGEIAVALLVAGTITALVLIVSSQRFQQRVVELPDYPGRSYIVAGYVTTLVCAAVVIGWLIEPSFTSQYACEPLGYKLRFGDPSRSWLPPGTACTYHFPPSDSAASKIVIHPTWWRLIPLLIALGGFPATWHLSRLLRGVGAHEPPK